MDDVIDEATIDALYAQLASGLRNMPLGKAPAALTQLSKAFTQTGQITEASAAKRLCGILTGATTGTPGGGRRARGGNASSSSSAAIGDESERLASYLSSHSAVISYVEACNHVSTTLAPQALLQSVMDLQTPVQVATLNDQRFAHSDAFPLLLNFLALSGCWACNLGEIVFTESQCAQLCKAVRAGGVGFLFVEVQNVGKVEVRKLKDVIKANRKRRLDDKTEPWLLSSDPSDPSAKARNAVIKSLPCHKMWFGPMDLDRNKRFEEARKGQSNAPGAAAVPETPETPKHGESVAPSSQKKGAAMALTPPAMPDLSQESHPYGIAPGWGAADDDVAAGEYRAGNGKDADSDDDEEDDTPLAARVRAMAPRNQTTMSVTATAPLVPGIKRERSARSDARGQPEATRLTAASREASAADSDDEVATVIKENEPQQSEAQAVEEGGAMITGLVKQLSSTMARQLSL